MTTKYLLDTSVLSAPLKKNPNAPLLAKLRLNSSLIITATPVLHELYFGCYRLPTSRKRKIIATFISALSHKSCTKKTRNREIALESKT